METLLLPGSLFKQDLNHCLCISNSRYVEVLFTAFLSPKGALVRSNMGRCTPSYGRTSCESEARPSLDIKFTSALKRNDAK